MAMGDFGLLNWSIVGAYIVGTLALGAILGRRVKTAEHYYLGNRNLSWQAIGVSVIATYVGALSFLGAPAWAYKDGFAVIFIHINYPIAVAVVITLFLPFFYNSGVASIYEYLERRFGVATRTVMSGIFLFGNIAYSGIMLYTVALVLQFITGMDVNSAILIVALVALTYTMLGGIAAVIWTDVIQSAILFIGVLIILFMLLAKLPEGLPAALAALNETGRTDPFNFSLDPSVVATVWTGVVAMSIYHVVVYGVNQMMVQRTLTARSLGDAKKAYIMMGYGAFVIFALFFFIGLLFYGYYGGRQFDNDNTIVLDFVAKIGVPGLMGLVTAAIVAAAMSSLDSSLNSMATVTTIDFYQKFVKKDGSPEHYLLASRLFTVGWAALIVVPAIVFTKSEGSVLEVLSKVGSFFVGAKLSAYFLGFYSRHTTQKGLLIGVVAGFLCLWQVETRLDIAWPWYCALGGAVSVIVGWVASVLLDGFQKDYHPYTVAGQEALFQREGRATMQDGWHALPGKVDRASWWLLFYFCLCLAGLGLFRLWVV